MNLLNLTNTTLPWNTSISVNPTNFTNLIAVNIPWFFPLILLVSFIWIEYMLNKTNELAGTKSLVIASVAFSFFSYLILAGGLTTTGMFYLFEIIALASFFFETLVTNGFP
jgi:hypothetical protein